jgi:hypothetical protein
MRRPLLIVTIAAFAVLTAFALRDHGFVGIFQWQLSTWAGRQVLVDLCIALTLVLIWLLRDAKALGRNPWPWVALTLAAGSFGPLLYLLTRPSRDA